MKKEINKKKPIKKKNKGFTLIELLAIVAILGVIALIAVPTVNSVMKQSKRNAAQRTIDNYIEAVGDFIVFTEMNGKKFKDGTYTLEQLLSMGFEMQGDLPSYSEIVVKKKNIVSYVTKIDDYLINDKNIGDLIEIEKPNENDTHFGIVYMDPTDLTKTCTRDDAENNKISNKYTGVKTGCMKWYIFGEEDNDYKLILDHHTTAHVAFNTENGLEPKEVAEQLDIDTKDWNIFVKPYIIAKSEIDALINPKTTSVYFLDSGTGTQPEEVKGKGLSKYSWLYNNVCSCEPRGCDHAECTNYGYWTTKSYIDKSNQTVRVWIQSWEGEVLTVTADRATTYGLRPAIKISKALFN